MKRYRIMLPIVALLVKKKHSSEIKEEDWFFDKVNFKPISVLAQVLGILSIISSFLVPFVSSGLNYMNYVNFGYMTGGYSGSDNAFINFVMWIIMLLGGIALLKLGKRKIPVYSDLAYAIEDYVKDEIKKSKNVSQEE